MEHPPTDCQEYGQGMLQVTFSRVPIHDPGLALGREDEKRMHDVEDVLNLEVQIGKGKVFTTRY